MKKFCSCCGEERDAETDFRWEYKTRGIHAARCKYCQSELSRQHYQNNKQAYNERARLRQARILSENQPRIYTYLTIHPCIDCGQADITLLEFDHVRGQKLGEIADMLRQGNTWSTIEAEIAKCEVRCANCHRKRTFEHIRNWGNTQHIQQLSESYQQTWIYLLSHPCVDCGETDICLLEFDHVRGQKTACISRLLTQRYTWSTIEAEIAKCEVRCANCHRKRTFERDGDWWKAGVIE